MENGTVWGHGAYLGPDFSAEYLHTLAGDTAQGLARQRYGRDVKELRDAERETVAGEVGTLLKENRYDPRSRTLTFLAPEAASYRQQIQKWRDYFSRPTNDGGLVSYFEVGTLLTPNHGHAAMMGVFGMLAVALTVFALRQVLTDEQWAGPEKFVRVSFWGLNIGLALMVVTNLFPGGVLQLFDVLDHGYWHARGAEFLNGTIPRLIEWLRMPGDLVFIAAGAFPLLVATGLTYQMVRNRP